MSKVRERVKKLEDSQAGQQAARRGFFVVRENETPETTAARLAQYRQDHPGDDNPWVFRVVRDGDPPARGEVNT